MRSDFKVAHFIHFDGRGGGPVVASQLAEGLHEDYEQIVFLSGSGKFNATCERLGIPVVKVPTRSLITSLANISLLAREFKRHSIDLLILHGQWAGPIGALAARLAGTPLSIYIAHCPAFYHSTTLLRAIRNYIAEKIPCYFASRTVTLSEGNHYNYLFRGWAPESRLIQIHNGVAIESAPADSERQEFRKSMGWSSEPASRHAVFVGRLDDQKRPDWLIETWAKVQSRGKSRWHLWIVGDGREKAACEAMVARLALSEQVHFVGEQPDGRIWLNAADLVIMTSLYEGHALVPLEAMLCKRCIAAFAVDGVTDSIIHQKTGLLCELGDTTLLAANIDYLFSNDDVREQMGRNGHMFVKETFPLSATLDQYRRLIKDLRLNAGH